MDKENQRIEISDLQKNEEELTDEEAKSVQGGESFYGTGVYKTTDAGKTWAATTVGGALGANAGNTVGGSLSVDPSNPNKR